MGLGLYKITCACACACVCTCKKAQLKHFVQFINNCCYKHYNTEYYGDFDTHKSGVTELRQVQE